MKYRVPFTAFIPLIVFGFLAIAFVFILSRGPSHALFAQHVGEAAPETDLQVANSDAHFNTADWSGRPYALNFFASWCVPCHAESGVLDGLARRGVIIIGVNYKDKPEALKTFLYKEGNPFLAVALDASGQAGIDWGITGLPETFVVDKQGIIRAHYVGVLTDTLAENELFPLWRSLQ